MKGAPPTDHEKAEVVDQIVRVVDQRGRDMDRRWGIGRLPLLVPIEVAERFRVQRRKFSAAIWEFDPDEARKHGEAMLRAFAKLDELAVAGGAHPAPVEQWEMAVDDKIVIVVRDLADTGRVETGGRQVAVWSLEEVANVIRAHPTIATAKDVFPGAVVESVRPPARDLKMLDDELVSVPFA